MGYGSEAGSSQIQTGEARRVPLMGGSAGYAGPMTMAGYVGGPTGLAPSAPAGYASLPTTVPAAAGSLAPNNPPYNQPYVASPFLLVPTQPGTAPPGPMPYLVPPGPPPVVTYQSAMGFPAMGGGGGGGGGAGSARTTFAVVAPPPFPPRAYVTGFDAPKRTWEGGLCGCCATTSSGSGGCGLCFLTCLCPCVTFGKSMRIARLGVCWKSGLLFYILTVGMLIHMAIFSVLVPNVFTSKHHHYHGRYYDGRNDGYKYPGVGDAKYNNGYNFQYNIGGDNHTSYNYNDRYYYNYNERYYYDERRHEYYYFLDSDLRIFLGGVGLMVIGSALLGGYYNRLSIRKKFRIQGSVADDLCVHAFCSSCALCQEHRTLQQNVKNGEWVETAAVRALPALLPPNQQTMC